MSLSTVDYLLINQYRTAVGVDSISTDLTGNTFFQNSLTLLSNLYVSSYSIFNNSVITLNNLYVSSYSLFNNNVTSLNTFNVSNNSYFNNLNNLNNLNISSNCILNTLTVSNLSLFNNNLSINSSLYVSGISFLNNIYTNTIIPINDTINIINPVINIGSPNSIVNINGTSVFISTSQFNIVDKIIALNLNDTGPADIGYYSGIQILGTNGTGYIKTSSDASRYEIKTPVSLDINYIAVLDLNNNFNVSGTSLLTNDVTILSNLNVSGITSINGSLTISSNLNVLGNTNIIGNTTVLGNLNISGSTNILGSVSILSNLNVNNLIVNNSTTIFNSLNIGVDCFLNSNTNINGSLFVNQNFSTYNLTILSNLNVGGNVIINNSTTINSNLNVLGNMNLNSTTINSSLYISNNSTINGNISLNNSLNILGNANILGNVTINSGINISGQFIQSLPNYLDNASAKTAGIPIWGWYRTGGMLKIRLDDTPPIIYLLGNTIISIFANSTYTDPGAYSVSITDISNPVYFSLVTGSTNLISNILISNTDTLITQTTQLAVGNYTATYTATDSNGLIGYNYRLLNIN
jgi:carbonic anhydrase/acetyltransferase-like protein (isoleucine patch superfamily)